jgi:hypothetical protein
MKKNSKFYSKSWKDKTRRKKQFKSCPAQCWTLWKTLFFHWPKLNVCTKTEQPKNEKRTYFGFV